MVYVFWPGKIGRWKAAFLVLYPQVAMSLLFMVSIKWLKTVTRRRADLWFTHHPSDGTHTTEIISFIWTLIKRGLLVHGHSMAIISYIQRKGKQHRQCWCTNRRQHNQLVSSQKQLSLNLTWDGWEDVMTNITGLLLKSQSPIYLFLHTFCLYAGVVFLHTLILDAPKKQGKRRNLERKQTAV